MKTSNLLLLGLLSFLFIAMVGVDLSLKKEFARIDRNDPYYGYSKEPLKPFKYIKLRGSNFTLTQIRPGKQFEIRGLEFEDYPGKPTVKWEVVSDTLYVNFKKGEVYNPHYDVYQALNQGVGIYILAPELSGINSTGIVSKVTGWPGGDFSVVQSGSGMHLSDNGFDNLSIISKGRGYVAALTDNHLGSTRLQVRDSSTFQADKNVFKTFQMQVDSTSTVTLPGNLLNKNINL
ncbi:hypothetical protein [Persicitalea jodogahamensis]|uniref:Uncharacterized protein n=1 Tax=Persicitalea jodogahamensis TaxID=402147 RepID=A0A8J3D8L5_9BACT|nr:hypothetical protein [Persicitalea jodogahamensis]GHB65790.1 hypothetical protein GCM10007390_19880 [Persicitalea jodogahamensis]